MADVINRNTLQFIPSANTPRYPEPDWKANPDMSQVVGVPRKYQKWDAVLDRPDAMTQAERDAVDLAALTASRTSTVAQFDQPEAVLRALVLMLVDELNAHTAQHNALIAQIAAASSLANLQTRVAANVQALPTRTAQQVKTAIHNKLGS